MYMYDFIAMSTKIGAMLVYTNFPEIFITKERNVFYFIHFIPIFLTKNTGLNTLSKLGTKTLEIFKMANRTVSSSFLCCFTMFTHQWRSSLTHSSFPLMASSLPDGNIERDCTRSSQTLGRQGSRWQRDRNTTPNAWGTSTLLHVDVYVILKTYYTR